jgi:hypothetical protein
MPGVEAWLPHFDVRERHEIELGVAPQRALELALTLPAAPDWIVRFLIASRGMVGRGEPIERFFLAHRFVELERMPTSWVVGAVGAVWRPRGGLVPLMDAAAWRAASVPGTIKAAADFRAVPAPNGSRLSTETRVLAVDDRARRAFRLYWLAIGPFSALIRRRWLRAIAARV